MMYRLVYSLMFAGALLPACKKPDSATKLTEPAPSIRLASIDRAVATQATIETGPRISGTLEPRERAVIRAETNGSVVAVGPELGQPVKKGQLLVRIEAKALGDSVRSAEAAVTSAKANVELNRREVERVSALVKGGAMAVRDLERAQSTLTAAEAALGQARAGLASAQSMFGDATVTSPIDGIVAARPANRGDNVSMGTMLYDVIDPSKMRLSAQVASDDLSLLKIGNKVTFSVRGYPGQAFDGFIERIAPAADPVTRQITILITIPNPTGSLIAGLFADGRVEAEARPALVIPFATIDTTGDQPTVVRVKDGKAERVVVQIGLRDTAREQAEVVSGLSAGDIVITTRAAQKIAIGTSIEIEGAPTPPAKASTEMPAAPSTATMQETPDAKKAKTP